MSKIVSATYFPAPLPLFQNKKASVQKAFESLKEKMTLTAKSIRESNPQTIVLLSQYRYTLSDAIGLSPQARLRGAIEIPYEPLVTVGAETDLVFTQELHRQSQRMGIPVSDILQNLPTISNTDYLLHHTAVIPMYFLQQAGLGNKQLVRLTMGRISYEELYTFGKLLQITAENSNRRIAVIGSSNLLGTHNSLTSAQMTDNNITLMSALSDKSPKLLHELGYPPEEVYTIRTAAFVLGAISGLPATPEIHAYESINDENYGLVHYKISKK